ncbi:WG repeat-containing protein [candidate division KSB1 bacterium]
MRKKIIVSLLILLMTVSAVFSQSYVVLVKPVGGKEWGYANLKGELIIDAQFRKCFDFSEDGFAPVFDFKKKQYYFINLQGETLKTEIEKFRLKEIFGFETRGFTNGLAIVRQEDKWGALNTDGKLAIPFKYDKLSEFIDSYAIAKIDESFYILDKQGNETRIENPDIIDIKTFSEQLAPYKSASGKLGFIDFSGKIVISAQFTGVGYFNDGLAWARSEDGQHGFIDNKGAWVIKPQFLSTKDFEKESGLARVKLESGWAYVDKSGNIMQFKSSLVISDFSEGLAKGKKEDKLGFYNNKEEWVIPPQFNGVREFRNGYAAVKQGELWGIIDNKGNWVIKPMFAGIKDVVLVK